MHFHGDRAGRLQKYDFGVRLHVLHNIGANQRIEPAGGHAELAENFGAEILTGFIGGIGHQHMIALLHKSEDGVGNGSRTTRNKAQPAPPSSSHIASCREKCVRVPRRP